MEGLYYLCSENKGADQLRGYREADLCLCFSICEKPVFSRRGSYLIIFAVNSVDADQAIGTLWLVGIFDVCLGIILMCMERSGVFVFVGLDLVRHKLEMVLFHRKVRRRCL